MARFPRGQQVAHPAGLVLLKLLTLGESDVAMGRVKPLAAVAKQLRTERMRGIHQKLNTNRDT